MPPAKKKTTKKKSAAGNSQPFELYPANPAKSLPPPRPPTLTRCRICNVSMPHLNFEWPAVPLTLTISAIKQAIIKRHGGAVYDVRLWRDNVRSDTVIKEDEETLTLRALGVKGVSSSDMDQLPVVTLHYDFQPALVDDPIASITCQTRESNVDLKAYLQMHR